MRGFRFRIRLRTMLALVMIAGVLSWGGVRIIPWARQMWTTSTEHRDMANFIRSNQRLDLKLADQLEKKARALAQQAGSGDEILRRQAEHDLREATYYRRMARYHAELERCYRRGAARPWEPLPPLPEAPTP